MRGEEGIWEGRAGQGCEGQWARDGRFDMRKGKGKDIYVKFEKRLLTQ